MNPRPGNIGTMRARRPELPDELAGGAFRAIASLYASGCLFATTLVVANGDNSLFSYLHLAFIAALACLLLTRGFVDGVLRPMARNWSNAFLVIFLGYFLIMTLLHPDAEVKERHMRLISTALIPGLLMGYVAFAVYGSRAAVVFTRGRWRPGPFRILIDLAAVSAYVAVLALSYSMLTPLLGENLFLLDVPEEQAVYQPFGNYIALALMLFLHVISPYFEFRYRTSAFAIGLWAAMVAAATIATFLLAQMVGSNTGAAIAFLLGAGFAVHRLVLDFRSRTRGSAMRIFVVLSVAALSAIGLWQILGELPPLRLFDFQPVAATSE